MTEAEYKAYVNNELPKLGMSSTFNAFVNNTVWWIYDRLVKNKPTVWSSTAFGVSSFKEYFEGEMVQVRNSTALSEFEKFVLTQMYNAVLVQTAHAYNNPSPPPSSGSAPCLPQTKEEWKAVAESAFFAGLGYGLQLGWAGARAGAIATTAAGNPVAGGIIGGGIGFGIGFIGGAFAGGGGRLMFNCLWNKVAGQLNTYQCGDKVYLSWAAAIPGGCYATIDPFSDHPDSISPALKLALTTIYEYGVVPNRGYSAIPSSVTTSINDFIKYLNQ
jgi:hypothetical protein